MGRHGDNKNLIYISPRVQGLQIGLSYGADAGDENKWPGAPVGDDSAVWAAGLNFQQAIGDSTFSFSIGHRNGSQADKEFELFDGERGNETRTSQWHTRLAANVENIPMILNGDKRLQTAADEDDNTVPVYAIDASDDDALTAASAAEVTAALRNRSMTLLKGQKSMAMAGDNDSFTNVAVGVGFGAFQFNVAYATRDRGGYIVTDHYRDPAAIDGDPSTAPTATTDDDIHTQSVVKDKDSEWDTWGRQHHLYGRSDGAEPWAHEPRNRFGRGTLGNDVLGAIHAGARRQLEDLDLPG